MTIRLTKEPSKTRRVFIQGIDDLDRARNGGVAERGPAKKAAQPIRAYCIELADLAKSVGTNGAKPSGWQYFVVSPDQTIEAIEINESADGQAQFAGTSGEDETKSLLHAIRAAENLHEDSPLEFEMRVLRIQGLYITCIWLSSNDPSSDQFILCDSVAPTLVKNEAYTFGQILPKLEAMAIQRLRQNDLPDGQSA